ncbi:probable E3 ubiquitin-protein ligase HERC3 isoform X1 [Conger conger]|uniref:probable E3 ubiquitin-protein ligase HERC3 isoform X1 n=1 Tax=Conger conger TaxID=82655 RepID=UPI002A5A7BFF|nr:probable E3 ubiquitin-protein ligase HERC3 isoform X1 [Conger conger]XP_061102039.1 probable E3 ubiquitin-protein ligase HERC3 isoform X1 [Conger conger]XP_061102040.1 probable E3 ubiquitin-protein ligase HERC3 isoform X1 [Conger conger]XP_061102041.1 probable E3 ubiquitin-protein ligase HERC3 isoform X1 [Conger conger]XP_061102042.1 probable E3 ubiquitin-protein ligase HERC3 isoform X1 [Conger conger]
MRAEPTPPCGVRRHCGAMLWCWGSTADGQLGLGEGEGSVPQPRTCRVFTGRGLREVACGHRHSLFLLHDGSVYTCGSNSCGQLGTDKPGGTPELVGALDAQKISGVACGLAHSVAVNEQGQVFTWGAGGGGQLGLGTTEEVVRIPRLIKKLCEHRISQVMCGNQHCIALSKDGQLFTWGQNASGQLGLGKGRPCCLSPQPLKSLSGIPLAQITAGGDHSFALSLSGAVFGWGKNSAGQLGLNDEQDRAVPCHIKFLRTQKVVYISCGEEHTAALTKDGGLFTFGDGSQGQLGHDSTNNELLPRRVLELMGSEVSQIACGRSHTLAFVPSSGLVYAFGCNSKGQLGTGNKGNAQSPLPVTHIGSPRRSGSQNGALGRSWTAMFRDVGRRVFPWRHSANALDTERCSVSRIHCGGDHNFLLYCSRESSPAPEDFRIINSTKSISVINQESLNAWRVKLLDGSDSSITNDIILLLSSTACWNASFLDLSDDGHFRTNPKIPGIDLKSVKVVFDTLMKPAFSRLLEQATKSFESLLIPQLPPSPPDVEAMRIYLILSECPVLQDSKYYITLTIPLAMAILRLDTNPSKVLDNWWSLMDCSVFSRLVEMYKSIVVFLLTSGKAVLIPVFVDSYISATLKLLEKLHKVNQRAQHVEYNSFYIPDISNLVDIQEDYLKWFLSKAEIKMRSPPVQSSVTLCAFPFILNAQAKTTMLQTDAELQMQMAVSGANLHNVFMLLTLEPLLARNPFLVLHVRRDHLVSDALRELTIYSDVDLKKPLKVIFDGEEAVDAGGVTKEFFLLLLKELMDPVYGMFTQNTDSNLLWFSDKCFVEHNWFHLIGIVCGLAIYNSTVVDLHFPLGLYKKLLGVSPSLDDLKELSPTEGRSLQQLLDYEGDDVEETFCLNFGITREYYGLTEVKELVPGGENISVQKGNREEFVEAYLNYVFNDSVKELYSAFSSGFLKVCGGKILSLFQPSELMAMVVGNNNYNWEEMEKNAVYKGEYSPSHPTVKMFWEVFHEFPLEKKKQFLLFLTGSDRIPIHGMASLRIVIQSTGAEQHYLPVAHTCYNLLDLPRYHTKDTLHRRLTQAVEQYEGFSLV